MPLRFDERLERLQAGPRELTFWRARETVDIDGWRNAGAVDILEAASEGETAHGLTPSAIRSWRRAPA
ncbi:MAG: hypothetical protein WAU78_08545 [Roseiarcus sp.]|jgi:hypothetical protein